MCRRSWARSVSGRSARRAAGLSWAVQELPVAQRAPLRRGEHEVVGAVRPPGEVFGEQLDQESRQPDDAAFVGLGRPPYERAAHLGCRLDHLTAAPEQIETFDTQRGHLAEA